MIILIYHHHHHHRIESFAGSITTAGRDIDANVGALLKCSVTLAEQAAWSYIQARVGGVNRREHAQGIRVHTSIRACTVVTKWDFDLASPKSTANISQSLSLAPGPFRPGCW